MRDRRGVVIVMVLGVLLILALLTVVFARLQFAHREVSGSFTDDVRAKLVAQSGIEDALARLRTLGADDHWMYYGNDINQNGIVESEEVDSAYETVDDEARLEWAKNPSYAWEADENPLDPDPTSRVAWIHSDSAGGLGPRRWGVSGAHGHSGPGEVGGTYAANGDAYSIRVYDASSGIYLNDGLRQAAVPGYGHSSGTINLKLMLNNLGAALGCATPALGDAIIAARPPTGYSTKQELELVIGPADYAKVQEMVTVHAWVDKNVVNPVPLSTSAMNAYYPVPYYRGGGINPVTRRSGAGVRAGVDYKNAAINIDLMWLGTMPGTGGSVATNPMPAGVYGLDELFPSYVEVTWRAPVNVNTAPLPVLEALIADVQGFFLLERRTGAPHENSPNSFSYTGPAYLGAQMINVPVTRYSSGSASPSAPFPGWGWSWLYEVHSYSPASPMNYTLTVNSGGNVPVSSKPDFDEIGHLYSTARFAGSWEGTGGNTISALNVAKHVEACRKAKPGVPNPVTIGAVTVDYSQKHYGGPFRTWAQFHEFVDDLVAMGAIADTRTGFWQGATMAPAIASQAAADALKANFNPNCHLNELNPDANMFLLVDKTDLIRMSTEFTFRPTGVFEVEALGRVLRPSNGESDALGTGVVNDIRGEKKVSVTVKLYDMYRESTQRHFYPGAIAPRVTYPTMVGAADSTNNNLSLEVGPEPDNHAGMVYDDLWGLVLGYPCNAETDGYLGLKPAGSTYTWFQQGWGFEFDGYVRLATLGGPFKYTTVPPPISFDLDNVHAAPVPFYGRKILKPQSVGMNLLESGNAAGTTNAGESMRGHFAFNDILTYRETNVGSMDWMRENLAGNGLSRTSVTQTDWSNPSWFMGANNPKLEAYANFKDVGMADDSPYFAARGGQYRLARSFRMPLVLSIGESLSPPPLVSFGLANGDLRDDGLYVERHAGAAYWLDEGVTFSNTLGTVSAWVKPYWYPEYTGKARNLFAMARYHARVRGHRNPENFNLMYFPAHFPAPATSHHLIQTQYSGSASSAGNDAPEESTGGQYISKFRPMSLFWDTATGCFSGSLDDVNHEGPWLEFHYGHNTFTLNHNDHKPSHNSWPNHLEGHRWSHIALQWFNDRGAGTKYSNHHASRTWVNGQLVGGKKPGDTSASGTGAGAAKTPGGNRTTSFSVTGLFSSGHADTPEIPYYSMTYWPISPAALHHTNALRLGEVSVHGVPIANAPNTSVYPRNFTADATFDELYMWRWGGGNNWGVEGDAQYYAAGRGSDQFKRGRYYHPQTTVTPSESFYISPWIDFGGVAPPRNLPPASLAPAPVGTGGEGGGSIGNSVTVPASEGRRRLLGISWTWHAEDYDSTLPVLPGGSWGRMIPVAYSWAGMANGQNPMILPSAKIGPQVDALGQGVPMCRIFIDVKKPPAEGGATIQHPPGPLGATTGYLDDGFSSTLDLLGGPIELPSGTHVRYKVWFQIQGLTGNHTLLATPYFDDITFYFDLGGPQFLNWTLHTS